MIFNYLDNTMETNEQLEENLERFHETWHEDQKVYESKNLITENDTTPGHEMYEPMSEEDQEMIVDLWRNSGNGKI